MDLNPAVTAAIVASLVSLLGAALAYRASTAAARHQVESARQQLEQSQLREVILKRIEIYPKLWRIPIHYETNWSIEGKPKNREWAAAFLSELNEFNLDGGLFFSQALYEKFAELRWALAEAVRVTAAGAQVAPDRVATIKAIIYGKDGPGLSTYIKDDLGSYRAAVLQSRTG